MKWETMSQKIFYFLLCSTEVISVCQKKLSAFFTQIDAKLILFDGKIVTN